MQILVSQKEVTESLAELEKKQKEQDQLKNEFEKKIKEEKDIVDKLMGDLEKTR